MSFAQKQLCAVCGAMVPKGIEIKVKNQKIIVCSEECKEKWEMIWKK